MSEEYQANKPGQDTVIPVHTFRLTFGEIPAIDIRGAAADVIQEGWFAVRNAQGLNVALYAPGQVLSCVVVEREREPRPEPKRG